MAPAYPRAPASARVVLWLVGLAVLVSLGVAAVLAWKIARGDVWAEVEGLVVSGERMRFKVDRGRALSWDLGRAIAMAAWAAMFLGALSRRSRPIWGLMVGVVLVLALGLPVTGLGLLASSLSSPEGLRPLLGPAGLVGLAAAIYFVLLAWALLAGSSRAWFNHPGVDFSWPFRSGNPGPASRGGE